VSTSIGSGLGSAIGSGIETGYGTSPVGGLTTWNPTDSHEIKFNPVYHDGKGLRQGQLVQDFTEHVLVQGDAAGPAKMNAYYKGLGRWVATHFGSQTSGAPVQQGGTTAYKQTHKWGSPWGQSLTVGELIPWVGGTVKYWLSIGGKIPEAQFSCSNGGALQCTFTTDFQDRFETQLATPTVTQITDDYYFTWRDMTVSLGAFGSEAQVDGIMKWTGQSKHAFADKRFNAGNLSKGPYSPAYAIKDEPVDNEFSQLTGTLETEYLSDQLVNFFRNNSTFSLIVSFTSAMNAGTGNPFSITFRMPCCYLISDDPTVTGPDLVKPTMNYAVRNNPDLGGSPSVFEIDIVSTETSL